MPDWDRINSILIMTLIALIALFTRPSDAATISVTHGESIQAAIDRASPGDTIEVMSDTYKESSKRKQAPNFIGPLVCP